MKFIESLKTRWMIWLWRQVPDCAEMSRLSSLALDQRQPFAVCWKMWLHHRICAWCRRYTQQIAFLRRAAPALQLKIGHAMSRRLSEPARQRIVECLRAECRH